MNKEEFYKIIMSLTLGIVSGIVINILLIEPSKPNTIIEEK
jgi:hypothetical protein